VIQPAAEAVRDTLAAVFRQPAFDRTLRQTLWRRFVTWLDGILERFGAAMGGSELFRWGARVVLVLLALLVLGRIAQLLWARRARLLALRGGRLMGAGRAAGRGEPWTLAQQEAAAGRYTAAAHLLYQALLVALAGRERLRLHPSRTVGDYGRELRRRSSPAASAYQDFAHVYEVIVYDLQQCDRERWERLHALAIPLVQPRNWAPNG
jgi:hypothetical protein